LPIVFVFKDQEGLEYMGWNRNFLLKLKEITPVDLSFMDKKATLNVLLEKIYSTGSSSLNNDELSFLDIYSKS
jgi:hypothetical protein